MGRPDIGYGHCSAGQGELQEEAGHGVDHPLLAFPVLVAVGESLPREWTPLDVQPGGWTVGGKAWLAKEVNIVSGCILIL